MQTIIQEMVLFCRRYGQSIAECRQKQQDHLNRPPKQREPKECFYQNMKKKIKSDQIKIFKKSSGKPLQDWKIIIHHSPSIEINSVENHHVDKTHKIIHKVDIVDQIARVISIETATQDQT